MQGIFELLIGSIIIMQGYTSQSGGKLLLVDDDPSLVLLLKDYLEFQGYQVTTVNNGCQALALLEKDIPDMIICDAMMPEVDGYQFLKSLRERQDIGWIPVLFLSALGQSLDRIKGLNLGANAYMNKPFEPEELLAQVGSMLNQSSQIQQHVQATPPLTTPIQINPNVKATASELKILRQLAKGFGNKKIAEELKLSQRTVESHVSNLLSKTGLKNRTELARWVIENRLE
jgi:DNA-binding NarL/FixJ family response regulator